MGSMLVPGPDRWIDPLLGPAYGICSYRLQKQTPFLKDVKGTSWRAHAPLFVRPAVAGGQCLPVPDIPCHAHSLSSERGVAASQQ